MSRTAHNLVYLLASQFTTWSVTLVVLIVAPRYLGAAGFGEVGFATTFVQFFTLAASLGTSMYLTRSVAQDASVLPQYVYNALTLKVVTGLVCSVLAVAIARAIGTTGTKLVLVGILCLTMILTVLNEVFVGAQAGLERMGRPAMWSTIQIIVSGLAGVVVLVAGGGAILWTFVGAVTMLIPVLANGRVVWPWTSGARHVDLATWRRLIRGGFPLMILAALISLYGTIDVPILSSIAGDEAVGWYTLALRFVGIPGFIAGVAMTAFFPSFSAAGAGRPDDLARLVNRAIRLVIVVSVPAAAGLAVLAEPLIHALYGDEFAEAVPVMRVLAIGIPLTTTGVALGAALIASERQNGYLVVAALAAVLNPIVSWFVINWAVDRYDNGAVGAALVTVGTEVFVLAGAFRLKSRGVLDGATLGYVGRTVLAAAMMAGAIVVVPGWSMILRGAIGAIIYLIVSVVLGTLSSDDFRLAVGAFSGAFTRVRGANAVTSADEFASRGRQDDVGEPTVVSAGVEAGRSEGRSLDPEPPT